MKEDIMFIDLNKLSEEDYNSFMDEYQKKIYGTIIEAEFEMVEKPKKVTIKQKLGKLVESIKSIRK